ncbi:MAG: transposase family protein [Saprospiraceae bacterium]|nr:transposase family protein [Saprospiraceae bacterium]
MGLKLRRKAKKRINRPYQYALAQPLFPKYTWSIDFMSDTLEDGRKVRILLIMDDYNREIFAIEVVLSITSTHVKRVLKRLIFERGKPQHIRTDNGPEFLAHDLRDYCVEQKIEQWFIQPGKPNQNGFIERLNRTFREDVLDA